jgi:hypothetical protein
MDSTGTDRRDSTGTDRRDSTGTQTREPGEVQINGTVADGYEPVRDAFAAKMTLLDAVYASVG